MTNNDVHLLLAFSTFFFLFVSPPVAMTLAVIWIAFAYLVEDCEGE
jgi:hypothetical protein